MIAQLSSDSSVDAPRWGVTSVLGAPATIGFAKSVTYFNTLLLLVNDHSNNNLTINYILDGNNKTETISRSKIKDVSFVSRFQMDKKSEPITDDMKNQLAANALFGGHPLSKVLNFFMPILSFLHLRCSLKIQLEFDNYVL